MSAAARNTDMVRSAIALATKANEVGLEAAAGVLDKRLAGWRRSVRANIDKRLAEAMVRELEMLAAGIRALKTTLNQGVEDG